MLTFVGRPQGPKRARNHRKHGVVATGKHDCFLEAVMNFANCPAPQPLCLLLIVPFAVAAVVVLSSEPRSLFFLSSPWQPKLRRISVRKSNKNKVLASENNLPQSGLLVLLNRL